ncbi:hypothetical protein CEK26_008539 [Fusarium fujikuroi]|nr:hypothetical protein CEK27_008556 [Fusarium fujikuroi]QGI81848.1 hypothetical protein CEK25_008577 [Fusarium fujikuroi]QGI95470.1 hypothetical protein CEK26_008539 [Fusarium fujikuroi]
MLASLPSIVSALAKEADESSKKPVETSINDLVGNLTEAPVATLDASSGSGSGAGGITRAIPASSGASAAATAIPVSGEFDGKITYYDRSRKLVRSCGNCKDNYGPRNVVTDNVAAVNGGVLCGINTNYGDTGTISNACQDSGKNCDLFDSNSDSNFDYTLKGFNSLTAFPSSHPVFSNFMKDVQINEAQEAIDPVAEFPFEDSFKSATNIKSREKRYLCEVSRTLTYLPNIAIAGQGIAKVLTATKLPIKASESSSCSPFSINTEGLSDDLKLISGHRLLQLEHAGPDMCRRFGSRPDARILFEPDV